MKLKFTILSLLMIIISCGNEKSGKKNLSSTQDDFFENEQKDTIDSIYIKFDSDTKFQLDIMSIQSNQITVKPNTNYKAYFFDNFSSLVYFPIPNEIIYPISPGDSLIISSKNNLPYVKVINNQKFSERELNLFTELSNKNISIFEYLFKRIGTPEFHYKATVNYVDSLVREGKLSRMYANWLEKEAEYSYLNSVVTPNIKTNPIDIRNKINIDSNLHSRYYKTFLWKQMNNLLKKDYSINNILKVAEGNFTGESKDYILFNFINETLSTLNSEQSKSAIPQLERHFENDTYINLLKARFQNVYNSTITEGDQLIQADGEVITMENMLSKYKGKKVYVDFWASWCVPCRAEFPFSRSLKKSLERKNVVFVYLSIDKVQNDWLKANEEEQLGGVDSYVFSNAQESVFLKKYKIASIPRYFLFDEDGKIINNNAPRPSSAEIVELLRN